MLEKLRQNEALEYQKLSQEEMKSKGILGRLVGPCADFINPTRNGRQYTEELWDKVFEDSIVKEKIENKCLFGELGHPADRTEVDMEKIAIALNEMPKKDKNGKLMACFDILDTPNGRILKTLCDYGTTIGISSRGTGDVIDTENGEEVDPDTYDFECFDAVIVPAVKEARLEYFTESLDKNQNSMLNLKKALCESLEGETEEHKKVMQETLNDLGIDLSEQKEESIPEEGGDKLVESETDKPNSDETNEAVNDGSEELIKSLTESIRVNAELQVEVKSLQEKLAVSDAKVSNLEEELSRNKNTIVRLTTIARDSRANAEKISSLEEELKEKTKVIDELNESLKVQKESKAEDSLTEELSTKSGEVTKLTEELNSIKESHAKEIAELKESLEKVKSDSLNQTNELTSKVKKAQKIAEGWKKMTYDVYDSYIKSKSTMLGVKTEQIRNRLPESYSLKDIDKVCDDLMEEMNMRTLPFRVDKNAVVRVTESKNPSIKGPIITTDDDDFIDEDSYAIAGFRK